VNDPPRVMSADEHVVRDMWDFASVMVGVASPPGGERRLAEVLAHYGSQRLGGLTWWVDPVEDEQRPGQRANLIVSGGAKRYEDLELVLLAHLDTSLASFDEIAWVTALPSHRGAIEGELVDEGTVVSAPGLGIAKGPAAMALAALASHHRRRGAARGTAVVLTCGGTHRVDPETRSARYAAGLHHARQRGFNPRMVVNVKAGAPGVLHEEPGSHALRVTVTTASGHTMTRDHSGPGAVVAAGAAIGVIEAWRHHVVQLPTHGQTARDVGVGAVRGGLVDKADLLPGRVNIEVYLVLTPDDTVDDHVEELRRRLAADESLGSCGASTEVRVVASLPAGRTEPDHKLVKLAESIWTAHLGPPPKIQGWKGSTDGALVRSWGIPVVRLGPRPAPAQPGFEAFERDQLECFARLHTDLLDRLAVCLNEEYP